MPSSIAITRASLRGWRLLTRQRGWASMLAAITGVLVLVQMLVVLLLGLQSGIHVLRSRTDLHLEVRRTAAAEDIERFYAALKALPAIRDARYVHRDKALATQKVRDPSLVSLLEQYGLENPFSDAFIVTFTSPSDYGAFSALASDPQWSTVIDPAVLSTAATRQTQLHRILSFLSIVDATFTALLIAAAVTLLFVAIGLVHQRLLQRTESVSLERMLGARPMDIFLPFIWEISLVLISAIILSALVTVAFLFLLPEFVPAADTDPLFVALQRQMIPLFETALPAFFIAEILVAPLIAAGCVMVSVQSFPLHSSSCPTVKPSKRS